LRTDVRVIAATNADLEQAIREKSFREDLFYRLNVVRLEIPPLQAHREDIPLLAEYFVRQLNPSLTLAQGTLRLMSDYAWPGNIRQLANAMRRAVVLCSGDTILPKHLGNTLAGGGPERVEIPAAPGAGAATAAGATAAGFWEQSPEALEKMAPEELNQLLKALHGLERKLLAVMSRKGVRPPAGRGLQASETETIRLALEQNRWNITEAARSLGIARNTLHRKIKKYRLRES
jgi:two-component system NtrC family response regulator